MFTLKGHTAIVTGGASGIGLATVEMLSKLGANIVIADLNAEAGNAVAKSINEAGTKAVFVETNVADADSVNALVNKTLEAFGSVEILMHFAGIGLEQHALDTTRENWDRIIGINLTGSFLVMQAAGREMVKNGYGRIVAMSSIAGIRGGTGRTAYGASKGGVAAMMRVMSMEWAKRGVTVNALAPGGIETALVKKMHDEETRRAYLAGIPMDRYGTPEEVAAAAVYLALPQSGYITGVSLAVDGGFEAAGVIKED
ncbi:SDR family NAD(P)-dependent oxidoreductase [Cochlodiniinecator piscidefendens]|uniref:SDR family NAD(P)-dependent oxidoreductase n=1 Tax=Cochlodiniinecator piscidefendens TaxID=2715756 RepID=UPI00140BF643|nr:glucose 1-dehydrogenase [Cochlodiniinecator piscidefendens]